MRTEQLQWTPDKGWGSRTPGSLKAADLVFLFGDSTIMNGGSYLGEVKQAYPDACVVGCSTAGEIIDTEVCDNSVVATAVAFDNTEVRPVEVVVADPSDSRAAGKKLAEALDHEGLVHVFVLSDGLQVNGSELVEGLTGALPKQVIVTGGLSGDGDRFGTTWVVSNGQVSSGKVVALGLYGKHLKVGYGSLGGWDAFGPERLITKAEGNVLYQLDGRSALETYKSYLGDHAADLPASGLLFPLSLRAPGEDEESAVVRTILAVDEDAQSMTFAGDLPEGHLARFMKANFNRLVDGAAGAATTTHAAIGEGVTPELAILISCVGRRMVLKQRTEDEVEAVRDVIGDGAAMTGFYSYGEICPFTPNARCELHNQTMTITTFSEN